jgi:hypothetical protein
VLLDLGRAVSFLFSILSLWYLLDAAFFLPAARWEERLVAAIARVVIAACFCVASGLLFRLCSRPPLPLAQTLPVRLFLWTLLGASLLFVLAWILDVYYVPLLWRNQPWVF